MAGKTTAVLGPPQAELLKSQGNQFFVKDKLGAAIDAYTGAITLCPTIAVYWTNRALCYRKRNDWIRVEEDCRKALELDRDSVKAHYMLGLAQLHQKYYPEAIRELEKALQLARTGRGGADMVEEIWQELARAKYSLWEGGAREARERRGRLREYLQSLMKADFEKQRDRILVLEKDKKASKEKDKKASEEKDKKSSEEKDKKVPETRPSTTPAPSPSPSLSSSKNVFNLFFSGSAWEKDEEKKKSAEDVEKTKIKSTEVNESQDARDTEEGEGGGDGVEERERQRERLASLEEEYMERVNTLENVFDKAGEADRPGEIPDHLCCNITMDIFRDPVITPCGISYERAQLMQHLKRGRKFDPISRVPLEADQIYPNLALREAVQNYLDDHGWAYNTGR